MVCGLGRGVVWEVCGFGCVYMLGRRGFEGVWFKGVWFGQSCLASSFFWWLGEASLCEQLLCASKFARRLSKGKCHFSNLVTNVSQPRYRLALLGTDGALRRISSRPYQDHFNFVHHLWKWTKKIHAELSPLQKCLVLPASGGFCYSHVSHVHASRLTAAASCSYHGRKMQEEFLNQGLEERHHVAGNTQTQTTTTAIYFDCPHGVRHIEIQPRDGAQR